MLNATPHVATSAHARAWRAALAAALSVLFAATSFAATSADAQTSAPPPTAASSAAPSATPSSASKAAVKRPVTAQDLRPPADILLDCAKAPSGAVIKLPHDLAQWGTIYCTKLGHIFNANDQFYAVFPDSGARASFGASQIDDKTEQADQSYFKSVRYAPMAAAEIEAIGKVDPISLKIIGARTPWRLDLTTSGGKTLSLAALSPMSDPFWVFPITEKGLGSPAFLVTSLETLNRSR